MTPLTKYEKETILLTNNADSFWGVFTYNVTLQKKLQAFSKKYPDQCRFKYRNAYGGEAYEIEKGRLSLRLNAPYSEERKKKISDHAKEHGLNGFHG